MIDRAGVGRRHPLELVNLQVVHSKQRRPEWHGDDNTCSCCLFICMCGGSVCRRPWLTAGRRSGHGSLPPW